MHMFEQLVQDGKLAKIESLDEIALEGDHLLLRMMTNEGTNFIYFITPSREYPFYQKPQIRYDKSLLASLLHSERRHRKSIVFKDVYVYFGLLDSSGKLSYEGVAKPRAEKMEGLYLYPTLLPDIFRVIDQQLRETLNADLEKYKPKPNSG